VGKNITKRFGHEVFKPVNSGSDQCADFNAWIASIKDDDPARLAAIFTDLRRPRGVSAARFGIALHHGGRTPMLNADKMAIERSLSKHFDEHGSKHAKLKLFKKIDVKPGSLASAKIQGSWSQHTWEVWTLRYSPGIILRNHRGEESDVFPGWGKMKTTLEQLGFKIVR